MRHHHLNNLQGGKVLYVSEEFFAEASNLLKPGRGIAKPGTVIPFSLQDSFSFSSLIKDSGWMVGKLPGRFLES